jgi:hypothetical protein
MKEYPYAMGDLLGKPHSYFYTAYEGREFLVAWRAHRDRCVAGVTPCPVLPAPDSQVSAAALLDRQQRGETVGAQELMDAVLVGLCADREPDTATLTLADALLKRFEVFKRIHRRYRAGFRAVDVEDHRDLGLYIRAAEMFASLYIKTTRLPYLNVLIKCLDTICSQINLLDEPEKARLGWLVRREREFVEGLWRFGEEESV